MIVVEFSAEQIEQLRYERFHHPHPRVQRKMEALLLKSEGWPHDRICRLLDISANTLRSYLRDFLANGVEGLKRFKSGGKVSELDAHLDPLCERFVTRPPHTIAEAQAAIEELTGIRRSATQVREFLKRCGFSRRKVGSLPAKADPDEQERFKKTSCCRD